MIKIRNHPLFVLREKAESVLKASVVALELPGGSAKDSVVSVAEKLYRQPEHQNRQQHPEAGLGENTADKDAGGIEEQHNKFGRLYAHAL